MKRLLVLVGMVLCFLIPANQAKAQDPVTEAIKAGVKKVIKAIDLAVQRVQNNTIWLQNAQKSVENVMSKLKLEEISDWVEKQRKLYDDYFQELWKVKSILTTYHRVKEIIQMQASIVSEYQSAYALFKGDGNFTPDEIDYMAKIYTGILEESLRNLDQVYLVINAFATQMGDAQRMEIIGDAHDNLEKNLINLRGFNNGNKMLSINRAKGQAEVLRLRWYYGL